jgi:glutamyl-tRNA synthetase
MAKEAKSNSIPSEKILAYALENAIAHEGKAQTGAVLPKLFQEGLKKEKIKEIMPAVNDAIKKVNSMKKAEQEAEYKKLSNLTIKHEHKEREGLPELPNAEKGKVVLRHAPFPSGAIHIGNAIPMIINDEYRRMYDGKAFLIIDDTIGSEEKQISAESYKMIPEDLAMMGIKYDDGIIYRSDRMNIYYKYAEELIKKAKAYVCFCNAERLKTFRAEGKECECRKKDWETNLKDWKWMFGKDAKEGAATLRLKTNMQDPDPAFRDRVLFRIVEREHPRIKGLKVWPMLEMTASVDDHLLNVTHVIRGNQLRIESRMEEFIWDVFGWTHPTLVYTPRIVIYANDINILSKSKSQQEVASGAYTGWDDPRTWSIRSLLKRGIQPDAIRKFIDKFGMSDKESMEIPIEMLYNENMKIIEPKAERYFFISNPVKIKISKAKKMTANLPLHPDYPEKGFREIKTGASFFIEKNDFDSIQEGKIYRLMHLFNFMKRSETKKVSGAPETEGFRAKKDKLIFHSTEQKGETIERIMHWLPALKTLPKVKVLMPDGAWIEGVSEKAVKKLKVNSIIQFERFAFCKLNAKPKKGVMEFWWTHK